MDVKTHLLLKQFLKAYTFTDATTFHIMYDDFEHKRLVPSFKHFVRVLQQMGVSSKSYRKGNTVIRRFFYDPLADSFLGSLHNLVKCSACNGTGVVKE
jgi:hypothetical protein